MKAFEVKNISFSYPAFPDRKILEDFSLEIEVGSFVTISGAVGSGKSTLALLLNGLLKPGSGSITAFGETDEKKLKPLVQVVFQNPENSFIAETVERDVAFGPENLCLEQKVIRERVDSALKTLGIENLSKRRISTLSGGQKQLVSLAGALAIKPRAIVLDEALSMLDEKTQDRVLNTIKNLCETEGLTVVLITHKDSEYKIERGKCLKT